MLPSTDPCAHTTEGDTSMPHGRERDGLSLKGCVTPGRAGDLSPLLSHPQPEGAVPTDFSRVLLRALIITFVAIWFLQWLVTLKKQERAKPRREEDPKQETKVRLRKSK